jgi:hypothetical protein
MMLTTVLSGEGIEPALAVAESYSLRVPALAFSVLGIASAYLVERAPRAAIVTLLVSALGLAGSGGNYLSAVALLISAGLAFRGARQIEDAQP